MQRRHQSYRVLSEISVCLFLDKDSTYQSISKTIHYCNWPVILIYVTHWKKNKTLHLYNVLNSWWIHNSWFTLRTFLVEILVCISRERFFIFFIYCKVKNRLACIVSESIQFKIFYCLSLNLNNAQSWTGNKLTSLVFLQWLL